MSNINQVTTLLLDSSFMPYTFLTGRATFVHLIKNNIINDQYYISLILDNKLIYENSNFIKRRSGLNNLFILGKKIIYRDLRYWI